jgi:hypothetical protein
MSNPSPKQNESNPSVIKATSLSVPQLYSLEKQPRKLTARIQLNDRRKTNDSDSEEDELPTANGKIPTKHLKNNLKKFTFTNKWAIKKDEKIKFRRRVYEFFGELLAI